MKKNGRKFIYLNCLNYDGTVFQTQVLDWLHLYKKRDVEFDLVQAFHIKNIFKLRFIKKQIARIKENTDLFNGYIFLLPSRCIGAVVNALIIYLKILRYLLIYDEILIFSRALVGREIQFLRKISRRRIIFFFDARAASGEENNFLAIKQRNFTRHKFLTIANVFYLEYRTLETAEKIFVVSKALMTYYERRFAEDRGKFVYYPCLSNAEKFYYSDESHWQVRDVLGINKDSLVLVYSGGISNEWHLADQMLYFFRTLLKYTNNAILIFLTNDSNSILKIEQKYPELRDKLFAFAVSNNEVYKYLNAADFGLLFRENTVMNNVASPTKFAEYILCGLPVIISEGIGDYSRLISEYNLGIIIKESELNDLSSYNFNTILDKKWDRNLIASYGKQYFSKESIILDLIRHLKS